ncbi:hypothetical protein QQF64_012948 [Cirrhinus molitorella]|uniref:Uncharacterized protein n=1 Tax=Cirrhinus molitorella TaxID=172907 RepID=A0ABR3LPT2_9TELE
MGTEKKYALLTSCLRMQYQVSVKIGEELKLDVLKTHVNKVVHQNKISTKWMVVWKRRGWVNDDGLTVSDGNLNINMLTVNDAGIYRVLDFDDEILITVTVTESSRDSKGNHTDDDKTDSELFRAIPIHVMGKKGASVVLPCEFEAREIFHIHLNRESKKVLVYQNEYCRKRVCQKGACDVIIKDLRLRDAGKYILKVYYINAVSVLEPQIRTYQLHIYDDIFVEIGGRLQLDVLLSDAHQVTHQNKSSAEWKEVWNRDSKKRVTLDRMNNCDGTLTIEAFMDDDAGIYRVLDFEGEIMITVTVIVEKSLF